MNTTGDRTLTTADLAAAAQPSEHPSGQPMHGERDRDQPHAVDLGGMHGDRDPARDRMAHTDADMQLRTEQRMRQEPPRMQEGGSSLPEADSRMHEGGAPRQQERLAPLFLPQIAQNFRTQWDDVQIGFVDDPRQAVRHADELVAQVMKNLAQTFAEERANVEGELDHADTEHLRVALQRYRSFFQRLLSL